ncbi:MAG: hypothetical protein KF758_16210 [Anaerolineales bacterium]|nr:hypothetical protein [Anaerolineales bacterium]MBX3038458.1 hypothetical protein [Anaerolineales bacterium]
MTNQFPEVKINSKKILAALIGVVFVLVGFSIWGQHIRFFGVADIRGYWHEFLMDLLMSAFYLDAEGNIPSYWNALLLFIPSVMLGIIGAWKYSIKDKFRFHWFVLAIIFLLLSFDEAAVLHERLIKPMRAIAGAQGLFYFTWVIPGLIGVALFGLLYLIFFLHLDKKFKILFLLSLGVYIGGVIGGEMLSGYFASNLGQRNFTYAVVASFEESIEMIGCSLIIYSLLEYMKQYLPEGIAIKAT